ncbi:phospholipase [Legionella bononiensis]|uniref:Phospholipase n=1 Tax=Legionella bononiensis TaxID=2793102 RepID=A0ABS1WF42_9GAMM|nr:phospholipase [Legionella bononiensis]MBL7479307.1 phospholipase [Legionella bononiensis]MBL7527965.1 phospholipase [Legionella bononiensis]MBL7563958.1 phospholipase [Legionella bononiensis]
MLKNITRALPLSLLVAVQIHANNAPNNMYLTPKTPAQLMEQYGPGFASLEHKNLGDLVRLHLSSAHSSGETIKLALPNGLKLSYGEIVMYAGDMFGDPNKTISSCAEQDRLSCFQAQFEAMGIKGTLTDKRCSNPVNQANNIGNYMNEIEKKLELSRQNGQSDWDFYDKEDVAITKKLNRLTCGGSVISSFIPFGTYIKLAEVNYDHFAPDSLIAYKTGHRYALETALKGFAKKEAGQTEEAEQLLALAYAQNAFANHYLTDSFSAGHMRTPRRAISDKIHLPASLNLLIANLMHNEDNLHGLNVVNAEGTSWIAYGDGNLYKPEAEMQRAVLLDAMQRSADGIYTTFITGVIPDNYPEMSLFPDYASIDQLNQTAPLFKVENGALLKRVKNNDYYDHHWTKYWSGFFTLLEFQITH